MLRYGKTVAAWIFGSIRGRILLLLLMTAAPLVADRVRGLEVGRQDRLRLTSNQLLDLANDAAARQNQMLVATDAVMRAIVAAVPNIGDPEKAECRILLDEIGPPMPWMNSLSIALPDGQIVCSNLREFVGFDVSDQDYFIRALATKSPTVSDFLVGRLTATPIIVTTYPALTREGSVRFVLVASLRLDWVQAVIAERAAPNDIVAFVIDGAGTVIMRLPDPDKVKAKNFADHDFVREIQAGKQTFAGTSFDGQRRLFASVRLNENNAHLVVGLPEHDVLQLINRQLYLAYGVLCTIALAALLAGWFGSDRFIVRPIRSLTNIAGAVGRGDFETIRAPIAVPAEFKPLVVMIRSMASQLRAREADLKETNRRLDRLAQFDALTGLGNRRSLDAHLANEYEIACSSGQPLTLLMIDVDRFKQFNDSYGHVAGDACLREIAIAITSVVRDRDFAARYGGEEFAILARGLSPTGAIDVAERLRQAVHASGVPHGKSPHRVVTVSIGIASIVPHNGDLPIQLIEKADTALYAAKKQGRDRIVTDADMLALAG